jgi:hypothetical protein
VGKCGHGREHARGLAEEVTASWTTGGALLTHTNRRLIEFAIYSKYVRALQREKENIKFYWKAMIEGDIFIYILSFS